MHRTAASQVGSSTGRGVTSVSGVRIAAKTADEAR